MECIVMAGFNETIIGGRCSFWSSDKKMEQKWLIYFYRGNGIYIIDLQKTVKRFRRPIIYSRGGERPAGSF